MEVQLFFILNWGPVDIFKNQVILLHFYLGGNMTLTAEKEHMKEDEFRVKCFVEKTLQYSTEVRNLM